MRRIFVGIDLGIHSLKVTLLSLDPPRTLGPALAWQLARIDGLPPGHSEQRPADWITALRAALPAELELYGVLPEEVVAIGVAGQQHGLVALDEHGEVIRPAKLRDDVAAREQCARLVAAAGGHARYRELTGNDLGPVFTAGKVLWLKEHEPENFARLRHILLPHDYLDYWLTGRYTAEPGDASGTGFYELRAGRWARPIVDAIDPSLHECLPELVPAGSVLGPVRGEVARDLGISEHTVVASGGGDRMMAAIGAGCVAPGRAMVCLGPSATLAAYSSAPVVDPTGEIAAFRDSTGAFLPLGSVQNCALATEAVRQMFDLSMLEFLHAAEHAPAGCDGLVMLPYLTGERTPPTPHGEGVWYGLTPKTMTRAHLCRAAIEGASFGLLRLKHRLAELELHLDDLRATGAGSQSRLWCQTLADLFGCPVSVVEGETAAVGAALHAAWSVDRRADLRDLCGAVFAPGNHHVRPDASRAVALDAAWHRFESARAALTPVFAGNHHP